MLLSREDISKLSFRLPNEMIYMCIGTIGFDKWPKGKIFDEDFEDYISGLRSFARGVFLLLNSNPGENCLGNDS